MKITDNVAMLGAGGNFGTVYPALTWDDNHFVLIDAGFPGQANALIKAINDAGVQAKDITDIILTHQDIDHIGCMPELLKIAPAARVWAHEQEAQYLDGRKTPIKLVALLENYDTLPTDRREWCDMLKAGFAERRLQNIQTLTDDEVMSICGGIEVVHTPGHTPGHICLFLRESRIMVCGDAANIKDGVLIGANPQVTYDMDLAERSFAKIAARDMRGAISYHCGYWANTQQ